MLEPGDSLPVHQEGQAAGQGGPRVLGGHQGDGRTPGGASGQAERDRDHRVEVAARNSAGYQAAQEVGQGPAGREYVSLFQA